jgi:signal transduction histidine kinase
VLNLVHNARDAILVKHGAEPRGNVGGHIIIDARAGSNDSTVMLRVKDNGVGMTEDVKRRCIEPFFTTKDRPQAAGVVPSVTSGSGMGLSLVHGIVQKSGGSLHIESQLQEGTSISLILPIALSNANEDSTKNLSTAPFQVEPRSPEAVRRTA